MNTQKRIKVASLFLKNYKLDFPPGYSSQIDYKAIEKRAKQRANFEKFVLPKRPKSAY